MGLARVLLVEDNPLDALLLTEQLGERYDFEHVESLKAAIHHMRRTPPDIAVVDLTLPDGRGVEVVSALQAAAPAVPLIAHSGLDESFVGEAAVAAGARVYVMNAGSAEKLAEALRQVLG